MSISKPQRGLEELMSRPLSAEDLDRATADMGAPLDADGGDRAGILVFGCGGELFALHASDVAKVVPSASVHRVPHRTNGIFRGVCNTDGELLLCMDLEASLGLPQPAADLPRVQIVVGGTRDRWAFLVDRICGITDADVAGFRPAPVTVGAARSGCIRALATTPDGIASVIDLARLAGVFRGAVS